MRKLVFLDINYVSGVLDKFEFWPSCNAVGPIFYDLRHWDLPVAVRHIESGSGAGFMVSRIRIRFQKIWPKQTQRILKPVSDLV